jgi:hypothetical protein
MNADDGNSQKAGLGRHFWRKMQKNRRPKKGPAMSKPFDFRGYSGRKNKARFKLRELRIGRNATVQERRFAGAKCGRLPQGSRFWSNQKANECTDD